MSQALQQREGPFPDTGSWRSFSEFIRKNYGMTAEEFAQPTEQEWGDVYQRHLTHAKGVGEIPINPATGMPTRPPKTPDEVALFQWWGGEQTRMKNEEMQRKAIDTLQFAFGSLRRGGEGSLAAFQSPHLQALANLYASTQYEEPDYSYGLLPEAKRQPVASGSY